MYINAASHYLPGTIVPNIYYTRLNGLTDDWIFQRSGIRTRTKAGPGENTNTMSVEAVKPLLDGLPYPITDIDLIVGATYTPYDTIVTLAHAVQRSFSITRARAVSISSACSSFINAMEIVEGYFATGKSRRALIVASEHNSSYSEEEDQQSGYLWGDGAGVVSISRERLSDDDIKVIDLNTTGLGHVGRGAEGVYLRPRNGGLQMPFGRDVFTYACKYIVSEVKDLLKKNDFAVEDVRHLIPHQANSRIIHNITQSLGLRSGEVIMNIEEIGNTGCASTIIALAQNWNRFGIDELIAVAVFGGGYSSGAMLLKR
jgi:3-oxoacyl-[acyl-carrier-protein] synthase III